MSRDDDELSRRQQAKQQRRRAGERSEELARAFMKMKDATLAKLELDAEVRAAIDRARAVTSPNARRRAERTLAGDLRGHDLAELAAAIANADTAGAADTALFHLAEHWRARLIDDDAALSEFPGERGDPLPRLIADARRERDTGRPPGARRALFRHVLAVLRVPAPCG